MYRRIVASFLLPLTNLLWQTTCLSPLLSFPWVRREESHLHPWLLSLSPYKAPAVFSVTGQRAAFMCLGSPLVPKVGRLCPSVPLIIWIKQIHPEFSYSSKRLLALNSYYVQPWNTLVKGLSVFNYFPVTLELGWVSRTIARLCLGKLMELPKNLLSVLISWHICLGHSF